MAKPVVDGLERELEAHARLFRVDRATPLAGELARRYELRLLPSMLVFDGAGSLVYVEQGSVDRDAILKAVDDFWSGAGHFACPETPSCGEP